MLVYIADIYLYYVICLKSKIILMATLKDSQSSAIYYQQVSNPSVMISLPFT